MSNCMCDTMSQKTCADHPENRPPYCRLNKEERFVSLVRVGRGDGEVLIALTESGQVFTGSAGRENPDQWHPSWSTIDWAENAPIHKSQR